MKEKLDEIFKELLPNNIESAIYELQKILDEMYGSMHKISNMTELSYMQLPNNSFLYINMMNADIINFAIDGSVIMKNRTTRNTYIVPQKDFYEFFEKKKEIIVCLYKQRIDALSYRERDIEKTVKHLKGELCEAENKLTRTIIDRKTVEKLLREIDI